MAKQAYRELIKTALRNDFVISVWDGEEWQVKRSQRLKDIVEAVKSVEEATLRFYDKNGGKQGGALVSAYGLEPEETVIDTTCGTPWIDAFDEAFYGFSWI